MNTKIKDKEQFHNDIREACSNNVPVSVVAHKYNVTKQYISLTARQLGLSFLRAPERRRGFKEQIARNIYLNGGDESDVAKALNLAPATVHNIYPRSRFIKRVLPCGFQAYRTGKCGCENCIAVIAEARRRQRDARKQAGPPKHGTYNAYVNYGCTCEKCKAAGSLRNKQARQNRQKKQKKQKSKTSK